MAIGDLGLRCGIEIHQQLEGKKLFCSCPTELRDDQPHFEIERKMRAGAGEAGNVDIAAAEEQRRDRTFVYQGYNDTTCLVETDSEPPHAINNAALQTALQFSALVEAKVFPYAQVMRKTIANGSATSGFQRTVLLGVNGKIKTAEGDIGLEGINLEEDAAREIDDPNAKDKTIFRLDRLGIPLIEVSTAPQITTPQQCHDVAKKLGLLLRSLPGVKRGLGTIRQDVNVSIKGGTRIEIKGAQDLKMLPQLVEMEAKRQFELIQLQSELQGKKQFGLTVTNLTHFVVKSDSKIVQSTLAQGGKALGMICPNFKGIFGRELVPGYRVGTECAGRVKVKAGLKGIFHSDELPNYGITNEIVNEIRTTLGCKENDAFVLVVAPEEKARLALEAVYERLMELWKGVPKEVRKANADGTTAYLRPIPGAARMYPETDVSLLTPSLKGIVLPETLEQKMMRFHTQFGLSKDLAEFVAKSDYVNLFEELIRCYPHQKPAFIAETLVSTPLDLKRQFGVDPEKLTEEHFKMFFSLLSEGKIHKDIAVDVLIDMARGTFSLDHYETLGTEKIHSLLKEIVAQNKGAPFSALMGLAMKKLAGKASGQVIAEELKRMLEQGHL